MVQLAEELSLKLTIRHFVWSASQFRGPNLPCLSICRQPRLGKRLNRHQRRAKNAEDPRARNPPNSPTEAVGWSTSVSQKYHGVASPPILGLTLVDRDHVDALLVGNPKSPVHGCRRRLSTTGA